MPWEVDTNELAEARICFGGEFGYELVSWLPYLNFVAHELGVGLRTCSRPGSGLLYGFSDDHIEMEFTWRPDRFGSTSSEEAFRSRFGRSAVFPRQPQDGRAFPLSIGGIRWEHQWIHSRLASANYRALTLPTSPAHFLPDRPIAVINNKDFENWGNRDPQLRESFTSDDLVTLRDILIERGFFVVYHPFVEPVQEDRFAIQDEALFGGPGSLDMRAVYGSASSAEQVMQLQLALYGAAQLAVCPQGGNSFLPIILGLRTVVLSTRGRLIEYQDLARLYSADVHVHTSVRSIIAALRWTPEFAAEIDDD